jgi:hypothetical protein
MAARPGPGRAAPARHASQLTASFEHSEATFDGGSGDDAGGPLLGGAVRGVGGDDPLTGNCNKSVPNGCGRPKGSYARAMASLPLPGEPSGHPVDIGQRTEAAIVSEFVRRGYRVLLRSA